MHVLIISGTGFIGAKVVQQLVKDGHHVTVFHRGQTKATLPPNVNQILGDRRNLVDFVSEFQRLAPDVVLDMLPYTKQDAVDLMQTFRTLTGRMVVISSMDVYQAYGCFRRSETCDLISIPFDETAPLRHNLYPYRAYAKSPDDLLFNYDKILIEQIVMNQAQLPSTILRLPKVYGDGDGQRYLSEYVKRMEDQRSAILLETGKAQWRWTRGYVENVALAIAIATINERATNQIYNVGEVDALTETEWVESIGNAAQWKGTVTPVSRELLPENLVELYDWNYDLVGDTSRIRQELGYQETISRTEALRRTVAWEQAQLRNDVNPRQTNYADEDAVLDRINLK